MNTSDDPTAERNRVALEVLRVLIAHPEAEGHWMQVAAVPLAFRVADAFIEESKKPRHEEKP